MEGALGRYSSGLITEWSPPDGFGAVEAASLILYAPSGWTDGSFVLDQVTGVSSSGAGFFAYQSENFRHGASHRDSSVAPLLDMRRRFKAVMDVLDATIRYGVSLSRSVEFTAQWN